MPQPCSVSENTIDTDQSSFWDSSNLHWDSHKIGWAVAGGCTILVCSITWMFFLVSCSILSVRLQTILISLVSILQHCRYAQVEVTEMLSLIHVIRSRNYTNPRQQRQMLALGLERPACFDWWPFIPIVYAFYTCPQSMPSSLSFHIDSSDLTPTTHLLKLVCFFLSIMPAQVTRTKFHSVSLRGKVHPQRMSQL